jgi:DNA-binding PadR family transcriptional regulator
MGRPRSLLDRVVLGFVAERPGYGYDLSQRIRVRMGPGWQYNPSGIYAALSRLEKRALITGEAKDARGRPRYERVSYRVTDDGLLDVEEWLRSEVHKEPVREDVLARIAVAGPEHAPLLLEALEGYERECLDIIAGTTAASPGSTTPWERLIIDGVQDSMLQHLRAELSWAKSMRRRIEAFDAMDTA